VFELEHRVVRKDGTVGWMFSRAIPILDDAGQIVEWFGAASDVTERVKADQSFTRLFQASPAPFLVLAPDAPRFTIREVNDAYLAATMTKREGILGRGVFEAFPDNPDDPEIKGVSILRASLERVLATRAPDTLPGLKYDISRPDGSFEERWWSPVNSPVLNQRGEVEAIIHNANDVTDQRRAEAALRASEAQLRELNETLERRVAEALAERKVFADVVEGATATTMALDDLPEHQEQVRQTWARAFVGEEVVISDTFGDAGRERIAYEARFSGLRNRNGQLIGAWHTAYDISDRLRAEAELAAAQEALKQS
jgi:PAS domain-containing protein